MPSSPRSMTLNRGWLRSNPPFASLHGSLRAHAGAMWLRILNSQTLVQIFDLATSSPRSMTLNRGGLRSNPPFVNLSKVVASLNKAAMDSSGFEPEASRTPSGRSTSLIYEPFFRRGWDLNPSVRKEHGISSPARLAMLRHLGILV